MLKNILWHGKTILFQFFSGIESIKSKTFLIVIYNKTYNQKLAFLVITATVSLKKHIFY